MLQERAISRRIIWSRTRQNPEFQEGDIFRIIVPLNEEYSFDQGVSQKTTAKTPLVLTETEEKIITAMRKNPQIMQTELAEHVNLSVDGVRYVIKKLKARGILSRKGSNRYGSWQIHI